MDVDAPQTVFQREIFGAVQRPGYGNLYLSNCRFFIGRVCRIPVNVHGERNIFPALQRVCHEVNILIVIIEFIITLLLHDVIHAGNLFFERTFVQNITLLHKTFVNSGFIDAADIGIRNVIEIFLDVRRIFVCDDVVDLCFFGSRITADVGLYFGIPIAPVD